MSQAQNPPIGPLLLTLLAGAALGAVVVALTTPKSGPQLRGDLKRLVRRGERQAGELSAEAIAGWDASQAQTAASRADSVESMAG